MLLLCLHFRTTVVAAAAFLDAFQKVADMATNTRGKQMEGWLLVPTRSSLWALTPWVTSRWVRAELTHGFNFLENSVGFHILEVADSSPDNEACEKKNEK